MANGNGGPQINGRTWLLVGVAMAAGTAGTAGYQSMFPPRPDPFTGSEGRRLEQHIDRNEADLRVMQVEVARLQGRLQRVEADIRECEQKLSQ